MARTITARQALALLQERIDGRLKRGKVERAIKELVKEGRLEARLAEKGELTPDEYDRVEGEIRRMYAGWYQRRNVRGDFDAWVGGDGLPDRVMRLPYAREWSLEAQAEIERVPWVVGTWEWPTARLTGVLRIEDSKAEVLRYRWFPLAEATDYEREIVTAQWMTGGRVPGAEGEALKEAP